MDFFWMVSSTQVNLIQPIGDRKSNAPLVEGWSSLRIAALEYEPSSIDIRPTPDVSPFPARSFRPRQTTPKEIARGVWLNCLKKSCQ